MITDEQKAALGELTMQVIDRVNDQFGENAEITMAVIVVEVKIVEPTSDETCDIIHWHGIHRALKHASPHHVGGLLRTVSDFVLAPEPEDDD